MERDNRKNGEKINKLEEKERKIDKKIDHLIRLIDRPEQYSRRNCILVHGVKERENEDTDVVLTETLNDSISVFLDIAKFADFQ